MTPPEPCPNRWRSLRAGEIAIAQWLEDELATVGGPALVVYEDGAVPLMLARQGLAAEVAATTTPTF